MITLNLQRNSHDGLLVMTSHNNLRSHGNFSTHNVSNDLLQLYQCLFIIAGAC